MSSNLQFKIAINEAHRVAHRLALMPHILKSPQVRKVLRYFPTALRPEVAVSGTTDGSGVYFTLVLRELDGFKDKRLVDALKRISTDEAWAASTHDWTYSAPNRDYKFASSTTVPLPKRSVHARYLDQTEVTARLHVYICAYVKDDSPTCKVVTKGFTERVVREEIKEIVCA